MKIYYTPEDISREINKLKEALCCLPEGGGVSSITFSDSNGFNFADSGTVSDPVISLELSTSNAGSDTDKFLVDNGGDVAFRTGAEVLSDIGAIGGTGTTGTHNYIPRFSAATTLADSIMTQDSATARIRIDDSARGTTTTNTSVLIVRNNYPGDGTASADAMVHVSTLDATVTTNKYMYRASAPNMLANSLISNLLGRTATIRDMFIQSFFYVGTGSTSNYFQESFHSVANLRRTYASGNTTIGTGVSADNGFRLEVDTTVKVGTKLHVGTGANASIGTATLINGTVTVATTAVVTGSKIFVQLNTPGGVLGVAYSVPDASITDGVSFVINAVDTAGALLATDTSTVNWWIIN